MCNCGGQALGDRQRPLAKSTPYSQRACPTHTPSLAAAAASPASGSGFGGSSSLGAGGTGADGGSMRLSRPKGSACSAVAPASAVVTSAVSGCGAAVSPGWASSGPGCSLLSVKLADAGCSAGSTFEWCAARAGSNSAATCCPAASCVTTASALRAASAACPQHAHCYLGGAQPHSSMPTCARHD